MLLVASGIAGNFELSVVDPRPEGAKGRAADGMVQVVSLLNADGLELIVTNLVKTLSALPFRHRVGGYAGVAIEEHSGLLSAAMRGLGMGASKRKVTFTVVFAGIISNTASELGYVVLIPLAAMLFHSLGGHPLAEWLRRLRVFLVVTRQTC